MVLLRDGSSLPNLSSTAHFLDGEYIYLEYRGVYVKLIPEIMAVGKVFELNETYKIIIGLAVPFVRDRMFTRALLIGTGACAGTVLKVSEFLS